MTSIEAPVGMRAETQTVEPGAAGSLVVIEPSGGRSRLGLGEVWEYRELLYFLVWREVKVRYKQTVLGVAWAVLQPFLTMVVFSLFFGHLARVPSDGVPYPVFTYVALLPWQLFAGALTGATSSLVGSQGLISKVYFPRLLVPLGSTLSSLVDFGVAFGVLALLMLYYGLVPGPAVVALPAFVLLAIATALSVGLWLSVLNVRFRDVRYIMPFLAQLWLFVTPVAYPSSLVPPSWRVIYALNPMVGVVDGFRWALLGRGGALEVSTLVSVGVVAVLFAAGLRYFQRAQATIVDLV